MQSMLLYMINIINCTRFQFSPKIYFFLKITGYSSKILRLLYETLQSPSKYILYIAILKAVAYTSKGGGEGGLSFTSIPLKYRQMAAIVCNFTLRNFAEHEYP